MKEFIEFIWTQFYWKILKFFKGEEIDDFYSRYILLFLIESLPALQTTLLSCILGLIIKVVIYF